MLQKKLLLEGHWKYGGVIIYLVYASYILKGSNWCIQVKYISELDQCNCGLGLGWLGGGGYL